MAIMNYNPVAGLFVPVGKEGLAAQVEAALNIARKEVGEAAWKRGNSQKTAGGATEIALRELGKISYKAPVITGKLTKVTYTETKDSSGNTYQKVRVQLDGETKEDGHLVSLDIDSELAQGLIQKLDNCQPGQVITFGAFTVPVERNGRTFVNHKATVKDAAGKEIKAEGFWAKAQEAAAAAKKALESMGIKDPKMLNQAANSKKVEAHVDLLKQIEARFAAPAPAEKADEPAEI